MFTITLLYDHLVRSLGQLQIPLPFFFINMDHIHLIQTLSEMNCHNFFSLHGVTQESASCLAFALLQAEFTYKCG